MPDVFGGRSIHGIFGDVGGVIAHALKMTAEDDGR